VNTDDSEWWKLYQAQAPDGGTTPAARRVTAFTAASLQQEWPAVPVLLGDAEEARR
jgi:hypothetical protein